jgi:prevent-host-death family protein
MRAVTIKDAKAHLNELVEAATSGETVVLMRGSTHVAAIVPVSSADLDLVNQVSDEQAGRLWHWLANESQEGRVQTFDSAETAVAQLKRAVRTAGKAQPRRRASR